MAATFETLRADLVELREAVDASPGDGLDVNELLAEIAQLLSESPSEVDADAVERIHAKARQVVDTLAERSLKQRRAVPPAAHH